MTEADDLSHLAKAKGALAHASEISSDYDLDDEANKGHKTDYHRLLDIASIQASVAQAEALERVAARLEAIQWTRVGDVEAMH